MENITVKKEMTRGVFGSLNHKRSKENKWLANEIKTLFVIISKIKKEGNLEIKMSPRDFPKKLTRNNHYNYLDKILVGIKKKDFNLKINEDKYRNYSLFSYLEYDKGEEVTIKFNRDLKDLLFNESSFTKINIESLLKLKSYYSIVAKILFSNATNQFEFKMDIERFKTSFQIPLSFKDAEIRTKILDTITKEVDEVGEATLIKKGRKATHVVFKLNYNNKVITKKEVFTPGLEKSIQKCKRNLYVSKAWNGSMDKKIKKIEKEKGLEFTKELLDKLYISLNSEITTSLAAYANTIIKTIHGVKKEKLSPSKKVSVEKVEKVEKKELTKEEKEEIRRKNKELLKKMRIGG